jgi:hypothetical protein
MGHIGDKPAHSGNGTLRAAIGGSRHSVELVSRLIFSAGHEKRYSRSGFLKAMGALQARVPLRKDGFCIHNST